MLVRDSLQVATSNARRQRERAGAAPKLLKRRVVRPPPPIAAGALPRGTLRASDAVQIPPRHRHERLDARHHLGRSSCAAGQRDAAPRARLGAPHVSHRRVLRHDARAQAARRAQVRNLGAVRRREVRAAG